MTREEAIASLKALCHTCKFFPTCVNDKPECFRAIEMAIKSLKAWGKIDDDIASLQDIYSIGGSDTEKAIWENLQAVRKTIHEYLKEVSK